MAPQQPTILQIIPELETGGAERSTLEIAEAIVQAGGRALVVSEGGTLAPQLFDIGAEMMFFPAATKNPVRIVWNAHTLARLIANEKVDLVHARSRAPAWSAYLAARRTGTPFVTTYHGAYSEKGRAKKWYNSIMASGDAVIANSIYTRDLIQSRYHTPDDTLHVIYRGIDGASLSPAAVSSDKLRRMRAGWQVADGDIVVLNLARLTAWKGQSVLIAAIKHLHDDYEDAFRNVRVVLAGGDQGRTQYRAALESQIEAAGLKDICRIVGHISETATALAAANVVVVASTEPEAFGRAAVEAQAMACPVISTNHGAPPETVVADPGPDQTGWLVPPGDAAALADTLHEVLQLTPESRRAMGVKGRRHVLEKFALSQMCHQTLGIYDDLIGSELASRFAAVGAT